MVPRKLECNQASAAARIKRSARMDTKAITVHFPAEVRRQLKAMAGAQGRDMADIVAEAFNLLFVKHGAPELAPRKNRTDIEVP